MRGLEFVATPLLGLMPAGVAGALAIILFTIILRAVLLPLSLVQIRSQRAQMAIQPEMKTIQRKFKGDREGLARAQMALYKEYGINPAAGCLPLLIQLPILYCMFYALNTILKNPALHKPDGTGINDIMYPFLPHFSHLPNVNLNWFTLINPHWFISLGAPDPTHILPV